MFQCEERTQCYASVGMDFEFIEYQIGVGDEGAHVRLDLSKPRICLIGCP